MGLRTMRRPSFGGASTAVMTKNRRWRSVTPVSDFSITQKVRTALIEDGHSDLVVDSITETVHDLEEALALAIKRLDTLEQIERDRPRPVSDTGMQQIVKETFMSMIWGCTRPIRMAFFGAIGTASLGGIAWIVRMVWRGLHS